MIFTLRVIYILWETKNKLNNKKQLNREDVKSLKESYVLTYVQTQENKSSAKETISDEYNEKLILYGYVVVINENLTFDISNY